MKLHPLFRPQLEGGAAARVGRQDDSRGRVLRAARAPERRRRAVRGRHRRASSTCRRSRGSTTRCSRGCTRRGPRSRRSSRATSPPRRSRPTTGWWTRATSWPTCAGRRNMRLAFKDGLYVGGVKAGLMTVTGGRFPGGRIDDGRGRQDAAYHVRAAALHARRHAHVQQAGRGVQVGQRDPRHHPVAPHRRPGRHGGGRRVLLARLSGRACTSGWATSSGSTPPTASTARPPTCSARGGRRARAGAGPQYRNM